MYKWWDQSFSYFLCVSDPASESLCYAPVSKEPNKLSSQQNTILVYVPEGHTKLLSLLLLGGGGVKMKEVL